LVERNLYRHNEAPHTIMLMTDGLLLQPNSVLNIWLVTKR
jgi:hypothetical protein